MIQGLAKNSMSVNGALRTLKMDEVGREDKGKALYECVNETATWDSQIYMEVNHG